MGSAVRTKPYAIAGIALIILIWILGSLIAGFYFVPPPWRTAGDAVQLLAAPGTWTHLLITTARIFGGFLVAFILGLAAGLVSARPKIESLLRPMLLLMQGVPPILWAIPLILVLGFSRASPVIVIALICFPLVATNIAEGAKTVPLKLREMLDVFAPGTGPRIRELVIPHLRPFIAASIRLGVTLGIKASVVAEYFGANDGIGFQIQTAYQAFQVRKLFAWALLLILIILIADRIPPEVAALVRRISRRRHERRVWPVVTTAKSDPSVNELRERFTHPSPERAVELSGVSFSYQEKRPLIADVELRVETSEVAVVYGDSGTGKTTLLRLIAGVLEPQHGSVSRPSTPGFVFQDDRFLPWRTNMQNVGTGLHFQGYDMSAVYAFAALMIARVGLEGRELDFPDELSGGMKKRLAFARCFGSLPNIILMDEPFAGLDRAGRTELWRYFEELVLAHPVPAIIVTHFPEEVPESLGARYYRLEGAPARLSRTTSPPLQR